MKVVRIPVKNEEICHMGARSITAPPILCLYLVQSIPIFLEATWLYVYDLYLSYKCAEKKCFAPALGIFYFKWCSDTLMTVVMMSGFKTLLFLFSCQYFMTLTSATLVRVPCHIWHEPKTSMWKSEVCPNRKCYVLSWVDLWGDSEYLNQIWPLAPGVVIFILPPHCRKCDPQQI
jgi:hypothetical protein